MMVETNECGAAVSSRENGYGPEIRCLRIPETCHFEDVRAYMSVVSKERRQQIERYRFEKDKLMSLFAGLLLRSAIMEKTGLANDEIIIRKTDAGKPFLENGRDFHFSLSHSGSMVALAFGSHPVGVDIETLRPFDRKIADRFFRPEEVRFIDRAGQDEREAQKAFYQVWTRKEAFVKLTGEGLSRDLRSFPVLDSNGADPEEPNYRTFHINWKDDAEESGKSSAAVLSICSERPLRDDMALVILSHRDVVFSSFESSGRCF